MPYYQNPTLFAAIRSHFRMLKRLGPEAWKEMASVQGSGFRVQSSGVT